MKRSKIFFRIAFQLVIVGFPLSFILDLDRAVAFALATNYLFIVVLPISTLRTLGLFYKRDWLYLMPLSLFCSFFACLLAVMANAPPRRALALLLFGPAFYLAMMLAWWVLSSVIDPFFKKEAIRLNPSRFASLQSAARYQDLKVGLALSGGGYRAALMHAGVLAAAEHFGLHVTHLSTVSGGSIIGAFYAAGGSPDEFLNAVKEGSLDLKRGLFRIQNVFKLLSRRSDGQANLLDQVFFNGMTLDQLSIAAAPQLVICTVDLLSGNSVGITPEGILERYPLSPWEKHTFDNVLHPHDAPARYYRRPLPAFSNTTKVSTVVAASGAFPLAFDAVPLYIASKRTALLTYSQFLLADGGITDNTGIDMLLEAHRISSERSLQEKLWANEIVRGFEHWQQDFILSSDASALFQEERQLGGVSTLGKAVNQLTRALNIIHRNAGSRRSGSEDAGPRVRLLSSEYHVKAESVLRETLTPQNYLRIWKGLDLDESQVQFLVDQLPTGGNAFEWPDANNKSAKVYETISADFEECLKTFGRTSTLSALFAADDADRLYRLGIYLFAFEWDDCKEELDFFHAEKEYTSSILKELLGASEIALTGSEEETFGLEYGFYDLFSTPGNGKRPFNLTSYKLDPNKRDLLAALVAHRVAHILYLRERPFNNLTDLDGSHGSLMEEIVGNIDFDMEREEKIDGITVRLLDTAGFDINAGISLIEIAKKRRGLNNVSRNIEKRLLAMTSATTARSGQQK